MRAAPAMAGWATKATSGFSRTSRWKLDRPTIIGTTMTVSTPASRASGDLGAHGVEIARQARHIARGSPARLLDSAQRCRDRFEARGERGIRLVRQSMVVLDVVDAALREQLRKLGEPCRRQPLRLERRAGQSARGRAHPPPQPMSPWRGPPKRFHQLGRKHDVVQRHVRMQRRVAEQHVDELPGIVPDGLRGERDADFEQPALPFADGLDAADDLGAHEIVRDRRKRHLDALLDRDGARALLDRSRVAADLVDGL